MSGAKVTFRKNDVKRALQAAAEVGVKVKRFESIRTARFRWLSMMVRRNQTRHRRSCS